MALGASFAAVLAAAQTGAEWAWERIYRDLAGSVRGYLRAHGAAEPDDLVAEVFLQLARNLHGFEGDEQGFRSWVFTVAHHRLIDERRARDRRPVDVAEAPELEAAGSTGDAEDDAVNRLAVHEARALLDHLSPDQRDVLLLRVFGGLTVEEVAAVVDKRPGAVKALQRRALASLQRLAVAVRL
jgi:RNA polymerase sigma-70 factor (ECF subfamily)